MRFLSSIGQSKPLDFLLRISLFAAVVIILSILSSLGPNKSHGPTITSQISSRTNTITYDSTSIHRSKIDNNFTPCNSLPNITHASTKPEGPQIDAAQLAKEQAARAEHEKKQNTAKALIIKYQRRKFRQLDMKQKVEKVGILVGVIVAGASGWWWLSEVLSSVF